MSEHVVIVGTGQAGAALAQRLRAKGFQETITMFGSEPHPPYQRPPLSKGFLTGAWPAERLHLRPQAYWQDQGICLRTRSEVTEIDPVRRLVMVGGEQVGWTKLALVTGAVPRPRPAMFMGLGNVFELRGIDDVEALRTAFLPGRRLLVVGGGFIGLEVAAVAAKAGLQFTVVEAAERVLKRTVCAQTSSHLRRLHEAHGVQIIEGARIVRAIGTGELEAVGLDNGDTVACDLALLGIGAVPSASLAEAAGVACADGIVVDKYGRTSAQAIWAAGDCAVFPLHGQATRLESVQNAIGQAEGVADDMLGQARPYTPVPWFWSDQYDVKLQIAGYGRGYDAVLTRADDNCRSHWYFRAGMLIAVDAINDARTFMAARRLFERGHQVAQSLVASPGFDAARLLQECEKQVDSGAANKQSVRTD